MARNAKTVNVPSSNVKVDLNPFVEALKGKNINVIRDASGLETERQGLTQHIRDTDARIGEYLWSEILHTEEHRNPTRLNQFLFQNQGRGARVQAMIKFLQVVGNFKLSTPEELSAKVENLDGTKSYVMKRTYEKDENGKDVEIGRQYVTMRKERTEAEIKVAYEKGMEKPWFKHAPEAVLIPWDFNKKLVALLEQASHHIVKPQQKEGVAIDNVNGSLLTNILAVVRASGVEVVDEREAAEKLNQEIEAKKSEESAKLQANPTLALPATSLAPKNSRKSGDSHATGHAAA